MMLKQLSYARVFNHPWLAWMQNPTLRLVYFTSLVFGFTAIAHENNLGATSSMIAGDSITQYGWTIAMTLGGMAMGYAASLRVVREKEIEYFLYSEILLTLLAGFSVILALWSYSFIPTGYIWFIRMEIFVIAMFVGIEDALVVRIADQQENEIAASVGRSYWFSNIGGCIAGALFGQWLIPHFGVFNFALALGLIDGVLVLINIIYFRDAIGNLMSFRFKFGVMVLITAAVAFTLMGGDKLELMLNQQLYEDKIAHQWTSAYGKKVLTCDNRAQTCKLFIEGQLQFSTKDEFIYHEMLVHPAMSVATQRVTTRPLSVLILGGGDGLAVREVLKYSNVGDVTLVDLDPEMTGKIAVTEPIVSYNGNSLSDPKVRVVNDDAYVYVRDKTDHYYDVVIIDLVDPDHESVAKLYSREFYAMINNRVLAKGGIVVTQSISPWFAAKAFWAINLTMESVFASVTPYHYNVPSFGDWGWQVASNVPFNPLEIEIKAETKWLETEGWQAALFFGKSDWAVRDQLKELGIISTLTRPVVFHYNNETGAWDDWAEEQR